jgi:hypothetical protein
MYLIPAFAGDPSSTSAMDLATQKLDTGATITPHNQMHIDAPLNTAAAAAAAAPQAVACVKPL